jgi:predicted DNA-binding transcriptional regulator AlpA
MNKPRRLLPTRLVCERYNICDRSVDRWVEKGTLPKPEYINKRRYFDEAALDAHDAARQSRP